MADRHGRVDTDEALASLDGGRGAAEVPHTFDAVIVGVDGARTPRTIPVERMYNLGSATRAPAVARQHQDEVAAAGITIAFDIPAPRIYPIAPYALTSSRQVEVQGPRTSGEVEIVLVLDDDLYVGVGSDHTDRELERVSIPYSKQACPNILAPQLWRFAEIADHWDECLLESWLDGQLYQRTSVSSFLPPGELLELLRARVDIPERGIVVFAGTIASVTGDLGFGQSWSLRLSDPVTGGELRHTYDVVQLMPEIHDGYRVPLTVPVEHRHGEL